MSLSAKVLRHRISIEAQGYTQDQNTGEMVNSWTAFASEIAAGIAPVSARELLTSAAEMPGADTRITIRYRSGVTTAMRVKHLASGALYDIQGVLPDPDSGLEWLTLVCKSGLNDGGR